MNSETTVKLLKPLEDTANSKTDGHFTIMKFTTKWKCCLGTVDHREKIVNMSSGITVDEAILNCINENNIL